MIRKKPGRSRAFCLAASVSARAGRSAKRGLDVAGAGGVAAAYEGTAGFIAEHWEVVLGTLAIALLAVVGVVVLLMTK